LKNTLNKFLGRDKDKVVVVNVAKYHMAAFASAD
jgi:hypothetical protein